MTLLIFFIITAMTVSFTCSVMEATLLSVSRSYIKSLINRGKKSGLILEEFKNNIDRPLGAILALNTIANTIGATGAGAQAEKVFSSQWVALFAICFTLAILVFSEIIPKTIGAIYWRKTAPATAYILKFIIVPLSPLVAVSQMITRTLSKNTESTPGIIREEMFVMAEVGREMKAISPWEEKVLKNILLLKKIKAREILTPRTVMLAFPGQATVRQILKDHGTIPFSRIPVYGADTDEIIGMVLRIDILDAGARGLLDRSMKELMRPMEHVPESISITRLIEKFIKKQVQMFVVSDEYGGTEGIVTLEDALETMLGTEIVDEKDTVVDMRELALGQWRRQMKSRQVCPAETDTAHQEPKDNDNT